MAINASAAEVLPAWLEPGNAYAPPEAVQALYKTLAPGVGQACERARRRIRGGYAEYVRGLRDARDALAESRKFKAWCEAYGLNYGTVCNTLSLAAKLATNETVSQPPPDPKDKPARLVMGLADDEEKATTIQGLRDVLDALGVKEDAWGQAVRYLLNYWHEHEHPKEAAAA